MPHSLPTLLFQSSLPRGERLLSDNIGSSVPDFNPRSREGSDEYAEWMRFNMPLFQSSLPRGERQDVQSALDMSQEFQSTLPRGERRRTSAVGNCRKRFQSTLPRGERRATSFVVIRTNIISIHAPTRGATITHSYGCRKGKDFNPRSHEGSDIVEGEERAIIRDFNPRSHEGSDLRLLRRLPTNSHFNPRSHEGSDSNFRQKVLFSLSKNCLKYLILTTNYFN